MFGATNNDQKYNSMKKPQPGKKPKVLKFSIVKNITGTKTES